MFGIISPFKVNVIISVTNARSSPLARRIGYDLAKIRIGAKQLKVTNTQAYCLYDNDIHHLSIYTSMKPSLPSLKHLVLALNSLDTLSDVRIKVFMLLF